MKSYWITFYSYKGGVGRTLALANIGALLARNGRRVVLIDFDLEAPGLDSFKAFEKTKGKDGVVEYVSQFIHSHKAPKIEDYVYPCTLEKNVRGKLWVMPAGKKDSAYNRKRSDIPWSELFESGIGQPFIENWKAAIEQAYQPDYVLVDSRTGLTDVGGICTLGFPNLVVMLFSLNEQNLQGTAAVAKALGKADPERIPQICYVATPLPNLTADTSPLIASRFQEASKVLGKPIDSTISYYSAAALEEKLFVLMEEQPRPKIIDDYQTLIKKVTQYNRTGIEFLTEQVDEACKNPNDERIDRLISLLEREFQQSPDGKFQLSRLYAARREINKALQFAEECLELDPTYKPAFDFLQGQLQSKKNYQKLIELIAAIEPEHVQLGGERLVMLMLVKGQTYMALNKAAEASVAFSRAHETNSKSKTVTIHSLPCLFNVAESKRRLTQKVDKEAWSQTVRVFVDSGAASSAPSPTQANQLQAMHIPYALHGQLQKANELLIKAQKAAESVGEIDDIFCVIDYQFNPKSVFLDHNKRMLDALDRGELWDGMKLPKT
ncbi:MAG: AAA family ATPase [Methylacidiphilales bacterium]|nr:AAA family ATPase [Candidatus Methylacidiphilales bacterium]